MQVDGVPGESTDSSHGGWIELLGMSWEVEKKGALTGVREASRAKFSDVTVLKPVDLASPLLWQRAAKNTLIGKIKIELCRAGGEKVKYLEYTFTDCYITKVEIDSGRSKEARETLPVEYLSFSYGKFEVVYTQQRRLDGNPGGVATAMFDLKANV
jgi:type VI secretion system secreted protein Hcp